MSFNWVSVVVFSLSLGSISAVLMEKNCSLSTDVNTLSCYTCMGRDSENCMTGLTCCSGSCFKLIDEKHDLVVKGCTSATEEDASMKVRELDVPLYWANGENVKGESYFCSGKEYCNVAPSLSLSVVSSVAVLFLFKLFA